ncbi:myosin IB heavy chain-like [Phoenix dactylifera]|uniref:Myosin IB heavy chain-like n=1 Tax=Phoenix dactylifera TaxID=42345 RepID=A0A8B7C495_PHODC|nr:myosin IB heavy chain-like [Phoenix dactylifera]
MDRFMRVQTESPETLEENGAGGVEAPETVDGGEEGAEGKEAAENPTLFMGMKVRRRASIHRDCKGDYIGIPSDPFLSKMLCKQGDNTVLFADTVLKFTGSGKMKRRILIITDFAIYLVDPDANVLKRRIALAAVDKLCLSELSDNFLAIIIPTEYDLLMASTRKTEIVTMLVKATRSTSEYELELFCSNRFEYHAAADLLKEVEFEEVDGGIRTRFMKKESK